METVVDAVVAPLEYFLEPDRRIYYGFLLSAAVLALWVHGSGRRGLRGALTSLVPWRQWCSASSGLDVQLWLGNAVVRALLLTPLLVSSMTVLLAVAGTLVDWFGPPSPSAWPRFAVVTAYTVALFVADDLTRYLVHRAMHRIPALWSIHRVHHSAEVLTPLTLYRVHPLESLLMGLRSALTLGTVSALFYYAFPGRIAQWEIVGVNAINVVFSALGSNLRHSHVWLSFGPRLERWFISPAQHQVHHSSAPQHFDTNFGAFLAVWDRLGDTLRTTHRRPGPTTAPLRFGLGSDKPHRDHLLSAYAAPLVDAFRWWLAYRSSRRMR
ncbi:MAG: sterol desaturase family protein [Myxococcota bacterium]